VSAPSPDGSHTAPRKPRDKGVPRISGASGSAHAWTMCLGIYGTESKNEPDSMVQRSKTPAASSIVWARRQRIQVE
jgi:hypothetical protein